MSKKKKKWWKLKRKIEGKFNKIVCAIDGCESPSEVIDSTNVIAEGEIPLCEEHWEKRIEDEERIAAENGQNG